MDKVIIVVADLGHFKAFRVTKDFDELSPRIALVESYDSMEGHGRLGDKLSDSAGRFGRGSGKDVAATGSGERHNIELETEKRLVKMIAGDICKLIKNDTCSRWHLAAEKKINNQIIENLKPEVKARMDKNITANLTKSDKSEILSRFFEK